MLDSRMITCPEKQILAQSCTLSLTSGIANSHLLVVILGITGGGGGERSSTPAAFPPSFLYVKCTPFWNESI